MISTLIALPYELARLPLVILDNLSEKLPETSRPRVTLDRTIGSADQVAGALLGNADIARRGTERMERTDKLVKAARLEQEAATRREQAREVATDGTLEAARKRKAAQERAVSGLAEADAAEARGKQQARTNAVKTASVKKKAADQRAASKTETAQARKRRVDSAAAAKKRAAQRKAKAELDEAREAKQSAADARADAKRLSDLADAKKEERKSD